MPLPELYIAAGGCRSSLQNTSHTTISSSETGHITTNTALAVTSQQKSINTTATTASSSINSVAGAVGSIVKVAVDRVLQQYTLHDAMRRSSTAGFGKRRKKSIYDEHVSLIHVVA